MARPGLTGHRKFRRLARTLKSAIVARGVLELLWDHCYESGEDYVGTSDDIEAIVDWTNERGTLTRALVDAGAPEGFGFIEPADSEPGSVPVGVGEDTAGLIRYRVHDLWHHAPDYVRKRRERELQRITKIDPVFGRRANDRQTAPNGGHCPPTSDRQDGDGRPPSPSHSPSPSPVKRGSAKPPSDSAPTTGDDSPTVLELPTVGTNGALYRLSEAQVAEWAELFPGIDVRQEMRSAHAWLLANPGRRKTVRGMPKFLVNWLTRSTDRGRRNTDASVSSTASAVDPIAERNKARYGHFQLTGSKR